jgi:hypothetical protein
MNGLGKTMEFYSAIKNTEIMLLVGKWMELENHPKRTRLKKSKVACFPLICGS